MNFTELYKKIRILDEESATERFQRMKAAGTLPASTARIPNAASGNVPGAQPMGGISAAMSNPVASKTNIAPGQPLPANAGTVRGEEYDSTPGKIAPVHTDSSGVEQEGIEIIGGPMGGMFGGMGHSAPLKQQDSVSMNVSLNGAGAGGVRDLMDILHRIESSGAHDNSHDNNHDDQPTHHELDHAEPIMGDMLDAMASEEMEENRVDFDEQEVEDLLKRFDENMNEIGGYGDPDYRKIFHALRNGAVESAMEEISNAYSNQDGGEIRSNDYDNYLEDLETNLKHIIHGSVDENSMEEPPVDMGMEEEMGDDGETWANSSHGDAGAHTHGIDAVTATGDDMNSKGGSSPLSRAPGSNSLIRHHWHVKEGLVGKLAAMYEEIKGEPMVEGCGDKKPYPKTWHDVDPKIGKLVDKMSPEEKVKKGYANPSILKKNKQQGVAVAGDRLDESVSQMLALNRRLNEAEDDLPYIAPEPEAPLDSIAAMSSSSPQEKCGPEVKAQIMAQKTFNAAYAIAKKAACPEFDWCQIVTVPAPGSNTSDPWFNAPGMGTGSVVTPNGKPTFAPVKENEQLIPAAEGLDRMREIAGTQVVMELNPNSGNIPEIKAGSKEKAIEIARNKGIKTFKFCGKYKVQAGKPDIAPMPTQGVPAVVGNPTISRQTAPGNPNTRPGSLRDRAAQANAARRPDAPRF